MTRITGTLQEDFRTFMIFCCINLRMRSVSKLYRKSNVAFTHVIYERH